MVVLIGLRVIISGPLMTIDVCASCKTSLRFFSSVESEVEIT
jgi:hypothetical protein